MLFILKILQTLSFSSINFLWFACLVVTKQVANIYNFLSKSNSILCFGLQFNFVHHFVLIRLGKVFFKITVASDRIFKTLSLSKLYHFQSCFIPVLKNKNRDIFLMLKLLLFMFFCKVCLSLVKISPIMCLCLNSSSYIKKIILIK